MAQGIRPVPPPSRDEATDRAARGAGCRIDARSFPTRKVIRVRLAFRGFHCALMALMAVVCAVPVRAQAEPESARRGVEFLPRTAFHMAAEHIFDDDPRMDLHVAAHPRIELPRVVNRGL